MKIGIIGAGPSGLMAAIAASQSQDAEITIFEKNEKIGKKLFITGKGRCNITNDKDIGDFFDYIPTNHKFLYSSLYSFSNFQLIKMLNDSGLKTKVERGDRVFPSSDKSSDVIKHLEKMIGKKNIRLVLNSQVDKVSQEDGKFIVGLKDKTYSFDKLILATGGMSYPMTGSTGDGYGFAKGLDHQIVRPKPSLCPLLIKEDFIGDLAGISLINIDLNIRAKDEKISEFGELLFTHRGISGPTVLRASSQLNKYDKKDVSLSIDFKPALDDKKLDNRILRDLDKGPNKNISSLLEGLLIRAIIPLVLERSGISPDKKAHQLSKEERRSLVYHIKNFSLAYGGLEDIRYAIVTSGGVDVDEIDPSTMESKLCSGLYFAGELIDVDALTGGFNLQIAFSTGYLAGMNAGGIM